MTQYKTIAESNNFIVLDKFSKYFEVNEAPAVYQTEAALEREFIQDLINQGYENPLNLNTSEAMLANVRVQLQSLNNMAFSDAEWTRFVEEYLDKVSDNLVEKTRKIIIELYVKCETDYVNGLKIYETIVEKKILETTQNQIQTLQKQATNIISDTSQITKPITTPTPITPTPITPTTVPNSESISQIITEEKDKPVIIQ